MKLLTDEEIWKAISAMPGSLSANDARKIEAAVLQKLAQGVSSESACNVSPYEVNHIYWNAGHAEAGCNSPLFTELQLTAAIAAARVQAINECAEECDRTASDYKGMFAEDDSLHIAATNCAKEIRALINTNLTTGETK